MYERVFNILAVATVCGLIYIVCSIPALDEPSTVDIPNNPKAPVLPTVTAPDVSKAFEVKETRETAKAHIDEVYAIYEYIDSVEVEIVVPPKTTYVGEFYITMYAATVEQCGNDLGITASGKKVTEDPTCWTVAVDPKVIPLGTKLKIDLPGYEDIIFEAADTGGDIKNYWIDVFTKSEPLSKTFDPTYADVWIIED